MKAFLLTLFLGALVSGLVPLSVFGETFDPADAEPLMRDRALLIKLEPGTRRARLQVKNEAGAWEAVQMAHLAGDEGFIKIRIPDNVLIEDCRAEVSMSDPFPYSVYAQQTDYDLKESNQFRSPNGFFAADGAGGGAAPPEAERDDGDPASPDAVVESDLWQWRGDTLYFFNQLRGLQVFDLQDPANPVKQASLRMPAVGDQMYILDDEHVLLLANYINYSAYGWWDIALPASSVQQTEAIVVRHDGADLEVVQRVAFEGDYLESRLVGERLYLVTRLHQPNEDEEGGIFWKQGLGVHAVNLSDPANPSRLEGLELIDNNGWFWNSVVTASAEHLLVTTSHYDSVARLTKSRVHVIPIGRELTEMEVSHTVSLKAHLPDKFKLRVKDDILTTVTQKNVWREELTTYVESFDLSTERARKLDELILAPQERLHATRFDGDRLYVVTFFVELRKDPLFVIDLTDPSNLRSLGELEIPGWSTYLVPEGDRLLSVGIEEDRVAVSLFDVGDPTRPSLVERVYPSEGRSWSEANWDEKAVGYLTEQDLLLLPIQTQLKTPQGYEYKNLMQLVDVKHDDLEVRGHIEHEIQGRRATALGRFVVSISGKELVVVDATDRSAPQLVAEVPLAWDAFKVLEVGDYLWQMGQGHSWGADAARTPVHVTRKDDPDERLASFELSPGKVAGLLLEGDRLYVARYRNWTEQVALPPEEEPNQGEPHPDGEPEVEWSWVQRNEFYTDVYDVSDSMSPALLGSVKHEMPEGYQSCGLDSVIGERVGGKLLWRPRIAFGGYYGGWFFGDIAFDIAWPGRGGYYGGGYPTFDKVGFLVLDTDDPAAPTVLSSVAIDPEGYAEFGPMVRQGDRLLSSYKEIHYGKETTVHRYLLKEVNFEDPAKPSIGQAVALPGIMEGLLENPNGGVVLFTSAPALEEQQHEEEELVWFYFGEDSRLQASIYDGFSAFLVSEVTVDRGRFLPTVVQGARVLKPGTDSENEVAGLLNWRWGTTPSGGELVAEPIIELPSQPSDLAEREGLIFAGHEQEKISVVALGEGGGAQVLPATLSGPVSTQRLAEVEVSHDRETAWLAAGVYGVETIDLSRLAGPGEPPLKVAAQVEGWAPANKQRLHYVLASGSDFVGALGEDEGWRYRSISALQRYGDWVSAHFGPTGEPLTGDAWLPGRDADGDGSGNIFEFVYQTAPLDKGSRPFPKLNLSHDDQLATWALGSDLLAAIGNKEIDVVVEWSKDLNHWEPVEVDLGNDAVGWSDVTLEGLGDDACGFFRFRLRVPED